MIKKISLWIFVILLGGATFFLSVGYKKGSEPISNYAVYLDGEQLGVISSKKELEDYIDENGSEIKEQFNVDKVYAPNGLNIKKIKTFGDKVDDIKSVYNKISGKKPFTIKGYQLIIKTDDNSQKVYVADKEVFNKAVEKVIGVFVGPSDYEAYKNNNQQEIETTGKKIQNVYIDNDITIKDVKIPVDQKIYADVEELAEYFIYGDAVKQKKYIVKAGDTITSVAIENDISTDELLMSNQNLNSSNTLLAIGQELVIKQTNPQIDVIEEVYTVEDKESKYRTTETYNADRIKGEDVVLQNGENGLERISQTTKSVNGTILYVQPNSKVELKPSIERVIEKGEKIIPNVGTLTDWYWPTLSGWTITTPYGPRINPVTHKREFHAALDIAGLAYGSNIYSSNYGTVFAAKYNDSYGNYVIINHNNGYYTLYAHMSRIDSRTKVGSTVKKGQVIGYIGTTGMSTGAHLHYEIWKGTPFQGGVRISPWTFH